ncbi:hypothetical protein EST38_g8045 [Candolleomyces aberdarensis]|uniref:Uncharacterized protein n=1 Tax=Candolleomyces aberdarensis TaxID=2316362 RepID=A0A4Q2DDL4_9AGAR|nr:hypothetical protein EST38_g8045 [Candolleomyces aberdarensis]
MVDTLNTFAPNAESRPFDTIQSLTLDFTVLWEEPTISSDSAFHRIPTNVTSLQLFLPAHNSLINPEHAPLHLTPQLLGNLTSFSICCDWNGGLQLTTALHECINVETLTIDFNDQLGCWYDSERFRTDGLLLPKVRTLTLKRASPPSSSIIGFLKTPSLEALNIQFSEFWNEGEEYSLAAMLHDFVYNRSRCSATFRSLYLGCFDMEGEELQFLLYSLPTITNLVLDHITTRYSSDDDVLFHLAPSGKEFLPNLESLKIKGLPPDWAEESSSLDHFLNARRSYRYSNGALVFEEPPDSLKELVLTFRRTRRLEYHELDSIASVESFRKDSGVLFHIGPLLS